ncbi:MAG: hypothetical protein ACE5EI_08480, partial [Thermodesulfobacteriota bacterium]
ATHYHELTELSLTKERVRNYNMAVRHWEDRIIFLRKVVPGGCSSSYGIQVARLAGLPGSVIERAGEILKNLETGELTSTGMPRLATGGSKGPGAAEGEADGAGGGGGAPPADGQGVAQMNLLGTADPLTEELRNVDLDNTTPMEALNIIARLKGLLKERS